MAANTAVRPMSVESFVELQRNLLTLERVEEVSQTTEVLRSYSNAELQDRGVVILKLILDSVSTGPYGRALLTFVKPYGRSDQQTPLPPNRFSSGDIVGAFSVSAHQGFAGDPEVSGVVHSVGQCSVVVVADDPELEADRLRVGGGAPTYSLALMGSDVTYRRLTSVLDKLEKTTSNPIVSCCFGETPIPSLHPRVQEDLPLAFGDSLNEHWSMDLPEPARQLSLYPIYSRRSRHIKGCSFAPPSNVAVDNLLERVTSVGGVSNVVRIGHPARVGEGLERYTLDAKLAQNEQQQLVGDIRKEIDSCLKKGRKAKDRTSRRAMQGEVRELRKELRSRERRAVSEVIHQSSVVFATCAAAGGRTLARAMTDGHAESPNRLFDVVVIDEAAQAIEAACWIPLLLGRKAVLAGDHKQLAATVLSEEAAQKGLQETLFGRLMAMMEEATNEEGREMPCVMLSTQYRMNETIMGWSNSQFYGGHLVAAESVKSRTLQQLTQQGIPTSRIEQLGAWVDEDMLGRPLIWIDTAGVDWMHEDNVGEEESRSNSAEVAIVAKYISFLRAAGIGRDRTAVISPYNRQVRLIRDALKDSLGEIDASFVSTVDSYQGQEQEVVVLSLVRSNDAGEVGFLKDYRRLNVAVTRAKRQLVIVGDSETIGVDEILATLYSYAADSGFVIPALSVVEDVSELSEFLSVVPPPRTSHTAGENDEKQHKARDASSRHDVKKAEAQTSKDTKATSTVEIPEKPIARVDLTIEEVDATLDSLAPGETHCFDNLLSAASRRLVHERAETKGLKHGSSGDGIMRYVWVRAATPEEEHVDELPLRGNEAHLKGVKGKRPAMPEHRHRQVKSGARPKSKKQPKGSSSTKSDKPPNICSYGDCSSVVSTYGLPCKYCEHRFCFSHILAEVHGCGDKGGQSGSGSEAKRKVVANRLADKIREARDKRRAKPKQKKVARGDFDATELRSFRLYCMSTSQDRSVRLWNPSSAACEPIKTYTGPHNRDVNDCCMTDDNAKFVSAGADKYVFLWDVATAKIIRRFARHRGPVNCCDFAGQEQNVLLTGSNDKTVMLWDWRAFTNNKPLQTLTEAYDSVQAIKVINEYEILTGSVDGCLRRYDIRYGRLTVDEFDGQSISCISASTFDGSENLVLTGSEAGSMAWYDVADDDSTGFASAPANSGAVLCVRAYESQVLATTQSGEILVYHSDSQGSGGPIMDANLADALKFEGTNFLLVMIGAVVRQVLDAILLALLPLGYIISRVWARMRQRTEPPGVVLVTGAGGEGLGAMLALQYAGPSTRKLILTDIHRASLEPVAEACRAKGTAEVVLVEADVCDEAAMAKIVDDHPDVDLVIANAGVAAHTVSGATAAQPTPPGNGVVCEAPEHQRLGCYEYDTPFR
ncbi:hypothetical protein FOZ60_002317 [Perkinsus olseni]|uniref:DNA helicase n=1 Tax=Perkinsus olseni TaxID=32597 RepID=A0A7J6PIU5_PEROL|nr:hypothetical protein FOZ60_002317 [Perkinsus olseni]